MTLDYGLLIPAKEQYAGECLEGGSYLQEGGLCDLGFRSLVSCLKSSMLVYYLREGATYRRAIG